jgi:hypothetical protein
MPSVASTSSEVIPTNARPVRAMLWAIYRAAMRRYQTPGGILARSIERTDEGWVAHEPCPLNTAEMLKAGFAMQARGIETPFDIAALMHRMMASHVGDADHQVVALMLWAASVGGHPHAPALWQLLRAKVSADMSQSMALGWILSALAAYETASRDRGDVVAFARQMYARLEANQDATTGLFFSSARREGLLRRRVSDATLSSQTYPILALTSYARAFNHPAALDRAVRCADRLCTLQGGRGQWWWRYESRRGEVRDAYPVYCVNQDSAIPAALGQLQYALGDARYDTAIARGLAWMAGDNELAAPLFDAGTAFVARSLEDTGDRTICSWDMHAYQPARFVFTVLSHPDWASEVTA